MKIEILGSGCAKCSSMFELTQKAVAQKGVFAQIEKVEDFTKIMEYGVMSTPALVVDGVVKSTGKEFKVEEIMKFL